MLPLHSVYAQQCSPVHPLPCDPLHRESGACHLTQRAGGSGGTSDQQPELALDKAQLQPLSAAAAIAHVATRIGAHSVVTCL